MTGALDDQHLDGGAVADPFQSVDELVRELHRQRVVGLGAVQGQARDSAVFGIQQACVRKFDVVR